MKKWRCTVCGYIHEGPNPPEVCPLCGVGPEFFEPVHEEGDVSSVNESPVNKTEIPITVGEKDPKKIQAATFKISYGLFIVTSVKGEKINGQCANTVFQITSDPVRIALGINRKNLTHEFIEESGVIGVTVLGEDGHDLVRRFGYVSGREKDKFEGIEYVTTSSGIPIVKGGIAYLEGKIIKDMSVNVGTHTLFVAEITDGAVFEDREAMTYSYFRKTK